MNALRIAAESPLVDRLGWALVHSFWEIALVALLLALILPLVRRRAAMAYTVSCAALTTCLLLPVVTFAILSRSPAAAAPSSGTVIVPSAAPAVPVSSGPEMSAIPGSESHAVSEASIVAAQLPGRRPIPDILPPRFDPEAAAHAPTVVSESARTASSRWMPWIVGGWWLGVSVLAVRNLGGWLGVQRLRRRGTTVSSAIEGAAVRIARELGLSRRVQILQSACVDVPVTIGALRPVILLPVSLVTGIPPEQLETLLAHELAHIHRHDYLVNLMQTAIETVLFHHPAVWWISRQVRLYREHCCDDLALRFARDRSVYVKALAACAGARPQALAPAASGGELMPRLRRVLGDHRPNRATGWVESSAILMAGAILFAAYMVQSRLATAETAATNLAPEEDQKSQGEKAGQKSAEGIEKETREISGILVDQAGFPVSRAYVNVPEQNVWDGVRTDVAGRFRMPNVPATTKLLLAWSQRSRRLAVIPITRDMPADRRYALDWSENFVEGYVVDPQGRLVEGARVTLHFSGPTGLSFSRTMSWTKTDAEGCYVDSHLPGGPGWTVRASLESGETTPAVEMRQAGLISLPHLAQRALAGPGAKAASRIALHSGRVVDERGDPIAGARVDIRFRRGLDGVTTDADGRWSRHLPIDASDAESSVVTLRIEHPDFVGWQFDPGSPTPPRGAMLDGTAVSVLPRGLRIRGVVRDSTGAPVAHALVLAGQHYTTTPGPENEPIEDCTAARTARDGSFSIGGIPAGLRHVTAIADGFAPEQLSVILSEETRPVEFALRPGRTVTGRVVDVAGNPLSGVRVGAAAWSMPNSWRLSLARTAVTGADGRFELAGMPTRGSVQGYAVSRPRLGMYFEIVPGISDIGNIPLYLPPVIAGRVVDDETGVAIRRFTTILGVLDDEGTFSHSHDPVPVENDLGAFEQKVEGWGLNTAEELRFALKIGATGYAAAISPPVVPSQQRGTFEVRLRKARPIRGTVLLPGGTPAADTVIHVVASHNVAEVLGTFTNDRYVYGADTRVTARADGTFELPSAEPRDRLLFLHAGGYAIVPALGFKPDQPTTLIPWGRIEGTFRPGGKPRANVAVSASVIRPLADATSADKLSFALNTVTDAEGRFVIDHVPALQLNVGAHVGFGYAATKLVRVEPGRTMRVTLGEDGPAASGRVDLSQVIAANPPPPGLKFDTSTSWVRAVRVDPKPPLPQGVDAGDWAAQFQSVLDGKANEALTLPVTFSELKPDGSYSFDGLAPGKYVLLIEIHGERGPNTCGWGLLLARGRADFTVADRTVALPAVALHAPAHPQIGSFAPEVAGMTAEGAAFSLAKLRGKFVVLDFWAGWCVPCRASQPTLQAIHARFGERASFVGLNFDYTDERAKKAAAAIKSPWPQVLTGPWDGNNPTLTAYGVETIPSLWLLDPAGKVLGKHLTPDELEQQLEKVLGKPAER